MPGQVLYMKCDANVEMNCEDVYLKDVASLQCKDEHILAKCKCIPVWHFSGSKKRIVVSALKLVGLMEEHCPNIQVEIVGETDVVIEYVTKKKQSVGKWLKIVVVCLVCFFGTAFTVMAYHNDVGIRDIFSEIYQVVTHREVNGVNPLEISYSIGLAVGILVFFNHVGNLKLTKDPTPIEVSMKNYERDVNQALVEIAERNGEELDV